MSLLKNDETDPVIEEIPIFLNQKASEDIRLLQYPIRTANRSLEQDKHDLGHVRDVQYDVIKDKLSLKYYLNTDSQRYMNQDQNSDLMHITYTSKPIKQQSNYCIGIMKNGKLHINPIESIYQMTPDFSHCNPNMVDNKSENESNTIIRSNSHINDIINCKIVHDIDNDDLYYTDQNVQQTRDKNKPQFLETCFQNKNDTHEYGSFLDIPPGITKRDALKLPLDQSVCYYLRECIVLKPSQIFTQLNCKTYNKQLAIMKLLLNYGYLINGRFIVKHRFLRDSLLRYYKNEWKLLIAMLFNNNCQITRGEFLLNVGNDNIDYEVVNKMFNLLCISNKIASKTVIWYLKHDNKDCKMIESQFDDIHKKGNETIENLMSKISIVKASKEISNDKNENMQKKIKFNDKEEMDLDENVI
eukprot:408596_1